MSTPGVPGDRQKRVAEWLRSPESTPENSNIDLGPLAQFQELASGDPELLRSISTAAASYRNQFEQIQALAGALVESQESLSAVGELTDLVVRVLETDSAFDSMLEVARSLTSCDSVLLIAPDDAVLPSPVRQDGSAYSLDSALTRHVTDALTGDRLTAPKPHENGRILVIPLSLRGAPAVGSETLGALGFCRVHSEPFTTADLRLIETIAGAIELGLSLHVLHEASLKRIAMAQEHRIASSIAQATLAGATASIAGVDVAAQTLPAHVSGGDFHFTMARDKVLWFAVGDVSGKGLPAAIVMTRMVSALRAAIAGNKNRDLSNVWEYISDDLFDYLEQLGMFVTIAFGYVDPESRTIHICNAGHSPVLHRNKGIATPIAASAPPLGIIRSMSPQSHQLPLDRATMLIIGSDGLAEQEDDSGQMYGYDRFTALCESIADAPATDLVEALLTHIDDFAKEHPRSDDQTAFVLQPHTNQLTLKPKAIELRKIGPWLNAELSALSAEERADVLGRLELATHEICMNVIDHGQPSQGSVITLIASVTRSDVRVEMRDAGREFDPDNAPVPNPDEPQVGGYGILIARRLSDRLEYDRNSDRNHWTLAVNRPAAATEEGDSHE